ncbi:MAG: 2-C-methyl-D-erythritol 2,4-cyclodiphosphate synthase [Spirochaetes bacterium]|nr:2-C-methyl-D-erythritol 2,4-cyclodiphosphate synthase [Spirochaetota bacterium]
MGKESLYDINSNFINPNNLEYVTGFGFDIHKLKKVYFIKNNRLTLGGYTFFFNYKFIAHSDGDIIIHAIIDSIISPLFNKDIGQLFPDNDRNYKNIDSKYLLKKVLEKIENDILNKNLYLKFISFDIVFCNDIIKISNIKNKITESLKYFFPSTNISIKGKRSEGLFKKNYCLCFVNSLMLLDKRIFFNN